MEHFYSIENEFDRRKALFLEFAKLAGKAKEALEMAEDVETLRLDPDFRQAVDSMVGLWPIARDCVKAMMRDVEHAHKLAALKRAKG